MRPSGDHLDAALCLLFREPCGFGGHLYLQPHAKSATLHNVASRTDLLDLSIDINFPPLYSIIGLGTQSRYLFTKYIQGTKHGRSIHAVTATPHDPSRTLKIAEQTYGVNSDAAQFVCRKECSLTSSRRRYTSQRPVPPQRPRLCRD